MVQIITNEIRQKAEDQPSIAISAIGLSGIIIKPGLTIIYWDIENTGRKLARIVESNMTMFLETANVLLPERPNYQPTQHRLAGVEIRPGKVFNATFRGERPITEGDVENINKRITTLYVFGYVRFEDNTGGTGCKAFIAVYNPVNDPRRGMFDLVDEDHKSYAACPEPSNKPGI